MKTFRIFSILVLVISFVLLIFKTNLFTIKTIDLFLQKIDCADEGQIRNLANLKGQNFFFLKNDQLERQLKAKFICIKKVNMNKILPDKVRLEVLGREPVALYILQKDFLATESSTLEAIATPSAQANSENYLVDNEGIIFAKTNEQFSLPQIFVFDLGLFLGKQMDLVNIKILEKAKIFGLYIMSSRIIDQSFILYAAKPSRIILSLDKDIDIQIGSLQLILEKAKIDSEELEFIDLRFDKPIVRLAPKKK